MGPGGHNLHTPESTTGMSVNQVLWSHSNTFLKKMDQNLLEFWSIVDH